MEIGMSRIPTSKLAPRSGVVKGSGQNRRNRFPSLLWRRLIREGRERTSLQISFTHSKTSTSRIPLLQDEGTNIDVPYLLLSRIDIRPHFDGMPLTQPARLKKIHSLEDLVVGKRLKSEKSFERSCDNIHTSLTLS